MKNTEVLRMTSTKFLVLSEKTFFEEGKDINIGWFVPFLEIEDRPGCEIFLIEWLKFSSHQDHYNSEWRSRLEYVIAISAPPNEHHARTAASVISWFGTNVGITYVQKFIEKSKLTKKSDFFKPQNNVGLDFFYEAFCINSYGNFVYGYCLANKLKKEKVSDLTYFEISLVIGICLYLFEGEGFVFLERTLKKARKAMDKRT